VLARWIKGISPPLIVRAHSGSGLLRNRRNVRWCQRMGLLVLLWEFCVLVVTESLGSHYCQFYWSDPLTSWDHELGNITIKYEYCEDVRCVQMNWPWSDCLSAYAQHCRIQNLVQFKIAIGSSDIIVGLCRVPYMKYSIGYMVLPGLKQVSTASSPILSIQHLQSHRLWALYHLINRKTFLE
jgi:hypothetical protein